jgi:hypothetical protein
MPIHFIIDASTSVVEATATGVLTCEEMVTYIDAKAEAGVMENNELIDVREATLDLSADDLRVIAGESETALAGGAAGRMALVTNSPLVYGVAKACGDLMRADHASPGVFYGMEAAREWLRTGHAPASPATM